MVEKLDADEIETAAAAAAGVDRAKAAGKFSRNLQIAVDASNEEARLTETGRQIVYHDYFEGVQKRLQTDRWIEEIPEIGEEVIEQPIFLTGLPRSGTTYFQYLLDNDPAFRLLKTWETNEPSPVHVISDKERERRRAAAQADTDIQRKANPQMDAMHLTDVDGPDECHKFLGETTAAIGFVNTQNIPTFYRALLDEFDLDATYEVHRRQLQVLQWKTEKRRWALKYPNHLIAMDSIVRAYPDASFLMTHRDPAQTLASLCQLTLAVRRGRSDHVDPNLVGQQIKQFVREHFERMIASRRNPDMDRRVIDVDYYQLAARPDLVLTDVYKKMGMELSEMAKERIAEWRQSNPQGKRGVHEYALEDFGLKRGEVEEEYHLYYETFGVKREGKA